MALLLRARLWRSFLATVAALLALEQIRFWWLRRRASSRKMIPGPSTATPLVGCIATMVADPAAFWELQRSYAPSGVSWNSLVGKFMVFATNPSISKWCFSVNGPDSLTLALHPNANILLGANNIAFQYGDAHKALRISFISLFSKKALGLYTSLQHALIKEHIAAWLEASKEGKPLDMWPRVRTLNALTSQRVFIGEHIADPARFSDLFIQITKGFLVLPVYLPGTQLWSSVRAREEIVAMLEAAVASAKLKASDDNAEPSCLLDFWTRTVLKDAAKAASEGVPVAHHSSDHEMACVMLDFLFAAQDASTSSLDWTVALMSDYPEVLKRVRQEQDSLYNGPTIDYELLDKMTYTRAVVKEILRFRPPAPMMPFNVNEDITVPAVEGHSAYDLPKGSVIIADIVNPCLEGFPNGREFDPDRMMPNRKEDVTYKDAFATFGSGPHSCVGQQYAISHLAIFLAELARSTTWTRTRTENTDKQLYLPTICPGDCLATFEKRIRPEGA